jgi:hypothetical protein
MANRMIETRRDAVNPATGWPNKPRIQQPSSYWLRKAYKWMCTDNHRHHGFGQTPEEAYTKWLQNSGGPDKSDAQGYDWYDVPAMPRLR